MFHFVGLLPLVLSSFFSVFKQKLFWAIVIIVGFLYRKMTSSSRYLFDTPGESPWRLTLVSLIFGAFGGFLGSLLSILVGISVNELGGMDLFFTAVFLMLIQQRFFCFAYAGGVLSLSHLFLDFPHHISVPQVIGLVAVLHLVESLLIYLSGSIYPQPMYLYNGKGKIVGGYNLQKFWPLPLVVLFAGVYNSPTDFVMPDWWPLIRPEFTSLGQEIGYSIIAIPAVLGYGDIAMSNTPREKTRAASFDLAVYSILLLLLAISAGYYQPLSYIAALFSPLGHEAIIYFGQRREKRGKSIYVPQGTGIKILYVKRGSPLARAGVHRGDILLTLNGMNIYTDEALTGLMEGIKSAELEYISESTGARKKTRLKWNGFEQLGYIPVPCWYDSKYLRLTNSSSIVYGLWHKLLGWYRKR